VGRDPDAPPPTGPLFTVGPIVRNLAVVAATTLLVAALDIDTLGDGLTFGAIVGGGILVATMFQIAIHPVFVRPLLWADQTARISSSPAHMSEPRSHRLTPCHVP